MLRVKKLSVYIFFSLSLSIDESICFVMLPQNMNFCST